MFLKLMGGLLGAPLPEASVGDITTQVGTFLTAVLVV